jgi:hypothetical protein
MRKVNHEGDSQLTNLCDKNSPFPGANDGLGRWISTSPILCGHYNKETPQQYAYRMMEPMSRG